MHKSLEQTALERLEAQLDACGVSDPADREIARSIVRAAVFRTLAEECESETKAPH